MASKYSRVNGRGHHTLSDNAKCECCKKTFNRWNCIAKDGKCYECHNVPMSGDPFSPSPEFLQFIAENQ